MSTIKGLVKSENCKRKRSRRPIEARELTTSLVAGCRKRGQEGEEGACGGDEDLVNDVDHRLSPYKIRLDHIRGRLAARVDCEATSVVDIEGHVVAIKASRGRDLAVGLGADKVDSVVVRKHGFDDLVDK